MSYMQRELFFIILRQQFLAILQDRKANKDTTEQLLRNQGFICAGEMLEICSRQEVQKELAQMYKDVLGTELAKEKIKALSKPAMMSGDYQFIEIF